MNFFGSAPPCPTVLPVTRVKRQFSSCSQYHSEERSMRLRKRSSAWRRSSLEVGGFFGFFFTPTASGPALPALAENIRAGRRTRAQVLRRDERCRAPFLRGMPGAPWDPAKPAPKRTHVGLVLARA